MGSSWHDYEYRDDEQNHRVTFMEDFYIGKYEITQAQWQIVMESNPSNFRGKPNHPVENVSWNDCQKFIDRLNQMGQGTFRLPTEAEWEYACRAGTRERFYWGNDPTNSQIDDCAWYRGNNDPNGTKEIGTKLPNPYGLFDMSGNVYEWCQDWYGDIPSTSVTDPIGPDSGNTKVLRGGGWINGAWYCRSSNRSECYPDFRDYGIGVRVSRTP